MDHPTAAEVYGIALAITSGLATLDEIERWNELRRHPPAPESARLCARCAGELVDELVDAEPVPEPAAPAVLDAYAERQVIRSAASGAWATCPQPMATIDGHEVPAPAGWHVVGGLPLSSGARRWPTLRRADRPAPEA